MRQESTDLAALVTRLEKELRTLKLALTAVLILVGGAALTAWVSPQDTITAKQFMVLDADGIPRGMFGVLADQASIGMMYTDAAGNRRVEMGVDPDGMPQLALYDADGALRSEIGMREDGSPTIVLTDATESRRIAMSATNEGAGQLILFGQDGTVQRGMVGTFASGEPAIVFSDTSETTRASLNMSPGGAAQWRFFGPDGTTDRATIGVYADGTPIVSLADSAGTLSFRRQGGMAADTIVIPSEQQ
jgi:hypothetical protein